MKLMFTNPIKLITKFFSVILLITCQNFVSIHAQNIPANARYCYSIIGLDGAFISIDTIKITYMNLDTCKFICRSGGNPNAENTYLKAGMYVQQIKNSDTVLLYDYSLNTGDTFRYQAKFSDSDLFIVDSIVNRVLADGRTYKHWYLHSQKYNNRIFDRIWIENLGDAIMGWDYSFYRVSHYPGLNFICSDLHQAIYISEMAAYEPTCDFDSLKKAVSIHNSTLNKRIPFPQPAQTFLTVELRSSEAAFQIYELCGRLLIHGNTDGTMDISSLRPGIFILMLYEKDGVTALRFVKE